MNIVGRKAQLEKMQQILSSDKAEFITVYGRRRVGKTYLISEFFTAQDCYFLKATGKYGGDMKTQLENFTHTLAETFYPGLPLMPFENWQAAFRQINTLLDTTDPNKKFVLFLDELP